MFVCVCVTFPVTLMCIMEQFTADKIFWGQEECLINLLKYNLLSKDDWFVTGRGLHNVNIDKRYLDHIQHSVHFREIYISHTWK